MNPATVPARTADDVLEEIATLCLAAEKVWEEADTDEDAAVALNNVLGDVSALIERHRVLGGRR